MKPSNRLSVFLLDFTFIISIILIILFYFIFPLHQMWLIFLFPFLSIMFPIIIILFIIEQIFKNFRISIFLNFTIYHIIGFYCTVGFSIFWLYSIFFR